MRRKNEPNYCFSLLTTYWAPFVQSEARLFFSLKNFIVFRMEFFSTERAAALNLFWKMDTKFDTIARTMVCNLAITCPGKKGESISKIFLLIPVQLFRRYTLLLISNPLENHESTHWDREKWPTFCIRNFQMHFVEWKCMNFDKAFTEFGS